MEDATKILKEYYGYETFRFPQDKIIKCILSGRDCIALLPTGFGKSVTFQVPAMILEGVCLVITPLIALMQDQVRSLRNKKIPAEYIDSSVSFEQQKNIYNKLEKGKVKLLYISPERLENQYFRLNAVQWKISLIALDEAHTILWGDTFRKAFLNIASFINILPRKPVLLALTATATHETAIRIEQELQLNNPLHVHCDIDRKNIFYSVKRTENKDRQLLEELKPYKDEKVIIYCITRKKVEYISALLKKCGYAVGLYHGGLEEKIKKENQNNFSIGKKNIIVCTNAFGMGIDIPDIRLVINYEMPASIEDLVQQMGRASRDGKPALGIVFFSFKDLEVLEYFIEHSTNDVSNSSLLKKKQYKKMKEVVKYCFSMGCRHQFLASYFGTKVDKCHTMCDKCTRGKTQN